MHAYYTDHFVLPLPAGHRFPMEKYRLLRDAVEPLPQLSLREAPRVSDTDLLLAHDADYVHAVSMGALPAAMQREIGFPWSEAMVERSRRSAGATVAACRAALDEGVAVNLAGGTHHAYANKGSGFCVFNDAAIAARAMQQAMGGAASLPVAIIDLDVHQGNGTAAILRSDPSIFTLSLHGEKNYPFRKEASDLDIGLHDGCDDATYLDALDGALECMFQRFEPRLLIYLAGADPHEGDRLGRLKLTLTGLGERDRRVLSAAHARALPVAIAMAGGYGRDIHQTVAVHRQTVMITLEFWRAYQIDPSTLPFRSTRRERGVACQERA